jgi:hypothetical protein
MIMAGMVIWILVVKRRRSDEDQDQEERPNSAPGGRRYTGTRWAQSMSTQPEAARGKVWASMPLSNSWMTPTGSREADMRPNATATDGWFQSGTDTVPCTPEGHQEANHAQSSTRYNRRNQMGVSAFTARSPYHSRHQGQGPGAGGGRRGGIRDSADAREW